MGDQNTPNFLKLHQKLWWMQVCDWSRWKNVLWKNMNIYTNLDWKSTMLCRSLLIHGRILRDPRVWRWAPPFVLVGNCFALLPRERRSLKGKSLCRYVCALVQTCWGSSINYRLKSHSSSTSANIYSKASGFPDHYSDVEHGRLYRDISLSP